jgi:hypothetical protein
MENIMIRRLLALVIAVATFAPAVRANADTVYAVSNNDGRIIRYDSANSSGGVVTLSGSGAIVGAAGIALGPDGNLYIGESGDYSTIAPAIRRFDLSSNTLSTVHTFTAFDVFPGALVFKGNDLIIGRNPFFGDTGAVMRLSNATGGTTSVSTYTSGFLLASSPGLAFGADGALYVSSMNYNFQTGMASGSVVKFDVTGGYLNEVVAGGGSTGLLGPTGLGIQGTNLYTASIMNGSVLATNLLSGSTSSFGQTSVPFGASPLAMLSDGGLIVGSAGAAGAIYRFDAAGNLVDTFNSGLGTIGGVVAVPEPSTAVAAAIGIAAAAWMRRRRMAGS